MLAVVLLAGTFSQVGNAQETIGDATGDDEVAGPCPKGYKQKPSLTKYSEGEGFTTLCPSSQLSNGHCCTR